MSCGEDMGSCECFDDVDYGLYIDVIIIDGNSLIEISNISDETISTKGLYLTDDNDDLFKWQMPSFIIRAGETLIINDINKHAVTVPIHKRAEVNFDVKSAEVLRLTSADGITLRCWSDTGECVCDVP